MTPRPFQERAMFSCGEQYRAGKRAIVLVSPTGSGKTCMGAMMVARLVERGRRVAWGAHRQELVDQAADTLRSFGLTVGVRGDDAGAAVQVGTYQTWVKRGSVPDADWLVSDECHHMADRTGWLDIMRTYVERKKHVLGLTATPERGDGEALPLFDDLVVAAQVSELQKLGLLVPLRIRRPGHRVSKDHIAQTPVEAYHMHASGRSVVVFAPHVKAAQAYADDFRSRGIECRLVLGDTDPDERRAALAAFAAGAVPVLLNVHALTEGFDAPVCSCIIVARGCGHAGLLIQMTGRGMRPHPGKTDCLLLDLRGVTYDLGRPDADAEFSITGQGISLGAKSKAIGDRECKVCHEPLGDLTVCPSCGTPNELVIPTSVNAELDEWADGYEAAKVALRPNRAVTALAGLIRKHPDGLANGSVIARFRGIFRFQPTHKMIAQAKALNDAAHKYSATKETSP